MPAITRSSVHGQRPSPDVHLRTESIEAEDGESIESDHDLMSSEMDEDNMEYERPEPLQSSTSELLRPLQETADRVSRQMEEFSQALDEYKVTKDASVKELWEETWLLIDKYAGIAARQLDQISKSPRNKSNSKGRKNSEDTAQQLESLHVEQELWGTTAEVLACKNPDLVTDTRFKQNTGLIDLHRYSTSAELWQAFLDVDLLAQQYEILLTRLTSWAKQSSDELHEENLESYSKSQRGDGIWTSGHIYTKEAIKKQKITRSHYGLLDRKNPAVQETHIRNADNAPLVTQMDPDAPLREDASLPKEDEFYEDAAWYACWQMLRRGYSIEECRDWYRERNEVWRSLVFRNSSKYSNPLEYKGMTRIVNLASTPRYASVCRDLGETEACDSRYENAVLGVIGGSYAASEPVCRTIDDHLFCLINALLIKRYEEFLFEYQHKLQTPNLKEYNPQASSIGQLSEYVRAAQTSSVTRSEAHQPHKYLECAIMADDFTHFFLEMGHAAAKMAHLTGQSQSLFEKDETEVGECAQIAAQNGDLIRMTVHLQLIFRKLGLLDEAYNHDQSILDNNVINYIGLLERHKKYSLMPLYASYMAVDRVPHVLGRVLSKVTRAKERDFQVRLWKHYNIPVDKVIYRICDYARRAWASQFENRSSGHILTKLTEYSGKIVRVKTDFIGDVEDAEDVQLVLAHEWVSYADSEDWGLAAWLMGSLYRSLLLNDSLATAKMLSEKVGMGKTSLKVTGMNLSLAAFVQEGFSDSGDTDLEGDAAVDTSHKVVSPNKRRKDQKDDNNHPLVKMGVNRTELADQSTTWAHLEHLVHAMIQLEDWQAIADKVESVPRSDSRQMKAAKSELRQKLQLVHDSMQPLLEQNFLQNPVDEEEKENLERIRNHYLPECILGYNSALYFAGFAISRQHLVQCMDLAQEIAQNDSLTQAFVASKRMQELVTAFALDSQALLRSNEAGATASRARSGKRWAKGSESKGWANIWQVEWNENSDK